MFVGSILYLCLKYVSSYESFLSSCVDSYFVTRLDIHMFVFLNRLVILVIIGL
jgi:hypothetical protein